MTSMERDRSTPSRGMSYVAPDHSSPLRESTVGGLLREAAEESPDRIALVEGIPGARRRWTYTELLSGPLPPQKRIDAESVYINPMPQFHTGGCVLGVLGPVQQRATLVNMVQFEPGVALLLAEEERATHFTAVPTMLIACMEHPEFARRDLSRLSTVCSGGSTVPADLVRRIESALGVSFQIIYGQTEASPGITFARPDDSPEDKANTLGPVLPQIEIKVIDPATGETVPHGVSGERRIRRRRSGSTSRRFR